MKAADAASALIRVSATSWSIAESNISIPDEGLPKTFFVGRRPIDRRHLRAHQAQVHSHLAAMMRPMAERVLNHLITRRFHDDVAARFQLPVCVQVFLGDRKSVV